MKHFIFTLLLTLGFCATAFAEKFEYTAGGQKFEGLYLGSEKPSAPGIILIHNWMGVTDETLTQAKRFQAQGYNVLAVDIYGAGVRPKDMKEASELSTKCRRPA